MWHPPVQVAISILTPEAIVVLSDLQEWQDIMNPLGLPLIKVKALDA